MADTETIHPPNRRLGGLPLQRLRSLEPLPARGQSSPRQLGCQTNEGIAGRDIGPKRASRPSIPDVPASICPSWRRPAHNPELRRLGWRCSDFWQWPAPLPASGPCCTDLVTGRPCSADRATSPPPRSSPPSFTVNRLPPSTRIAGSPIPCPISSLSHRSDCCTTLEYDRR